MEIMLALVGSVFLLFSSVITYVQWKYKESGEVVEGKVIAIEKYVSRSYSSSRGRSSQLMYRPIYQYFFQGSEYLFYSGSKNTISHKINQSVTLLKLPGGPEYVLPEKNVYTLISVVFGLMGVAVWTIFLLSDNSLTFKIIGAGIVAGIIVIALQMLKRKVPDTDFLGAMLKSNLVTREELEGRTVFWHDEEVGKEVRFINKVGLIIALVFMALAGGLTYLCWVKMNSQVKAHLTKVMFDFDRWSELKVYFPKEGELIGFLVGIVFILLSIHSLVYTLRKG